MLDVGVAHDGVPLSSDEGPTATPLCKVALGVKLNVAPKCGFSVKVRSLCERDAPRDLRVSLDLSTG